MHMSAGAAQGTVDIRQHERDVLPVLPALCGLLPARGLQCGSVTTVDDPALLLALLAGPSAAGGWTAMVGVPECGLLAAAEMGVAAERTLLIGDPGQRWAEVVAALLDGIQLVVVRPVSHPSPSVTRRLVASARRHRAALVVPGPWEGADLSLRVTAKRWVGVQAGHGCLRERRTEVTASGRGSAARPRTAQLLLPTADGTVRIAADAAPRGVTSSSVPAQEAIA